MTKTWKNNRPQINADWADWRGSEESFPSNCVNPLYQRSSATNFPSSRRGVSMTELLVAATLLISAMAIIGPLAVRSQRLQQDARHYQCALEEASNQLESLTTLEEEQLEAALAELAPSQEAQAALPNPQLFAETIEDENGLRVVMRIQWDRLGPAEPLSLVAWIRPPIDEEDEP